MANNRCIGSTTYIQLYSAQNLFVATGNYGQIATSQDGVNWEISQDFSIETPWDLTSIAYGATSAGNNIYIATGNANSVFVADAQ